MELFDKDKLCPKCGGDDLYHRWKQRGQRIDEILNAFSVAECDLIRTYCRTCGYRWSSLSLDTTKEDAEPLITINENNLIFTEAAWASTDIFQG